MEEIIMNTNALISVGFGREDAANFRAVIRKSSEK